MMIGIALCNMVIGFKWLKLGNSRRRRNNIHRRERLESLRAQNLIYYKLCGMTAVIGPVDS